MSVLRSEPSYEYGPETVGHSTLEYVPESRLENVEKPNNLPYNNFPYDPNVGTAPNPRSHTPIWRTVFGIPISTFVLAIALVVVIIAAAAGGGVAGTMAVKNAKESCTKSANASSTQDSTPTPASISSITTTSSAPSATYTAERDVVLPLDCPSLDGTTLESEFAHRKSTFAMYCNEEYNYDMDKAILSIIVYTLPDCLQACVSFNHYANSDSCTAAMFVANLTLVAQGQEANCFMQTDTGVLDRKASDQGKYLVTALIT